MIYLLPFITPLLLLFGWWQILDNTDSVYWVSGLSLVLIWLTGRWLSRHYFWQFIYLWINLSLVYLAQVLFSILLISTTAKYWLVIIWTIIWLVVFWLLKNYFNKLKKINDLDYLSFNRFLYYLGFWLLATSIVYLIIFINFSLWYGLLILLVATYLWSRELLIMAEEETSKYFIWLLLLTTAQVFIATYLLPLNFLISGTIIALWYFFIVDFTITREKKFNKYLLLFLGAIFILLLSSIIKYL